MPSFFIVLGYVFAGIVVGEMLGMAVTFAWYRYQERKDFAKHK